MMSRLERFKTAQESPGSGFDTALAEIRAGRKRSHWIWYIFPQLAGLGGSASSRTFAIEGEDEAEEYLRDPLLRARLLEITAAAAGQLQDSTTPLAQLMGSEIDAQKLVSSMTLFGAVARTLHGIEGLDEYEALATAADRVLTVAASQGYPACAITRRVLGRSGMR
jgi:uncharacterized protein (DUF1810 family)